MSITSVEFFIFSTVIFTTFYVISPQVRPFLITSASLIFYLTWGVFPFLLLLSLALTNYFISHTLTNSKFKYRQYLFHAGLAANSLPFLLYKLSNTHSTVLLPFNSTINSVFHQAIPIGIAFYTLQQISFLYSNFKTTSRSFPKLSAYLTYIFFFPKVLSGPVESPQAFLSRFKLNQTFNYFQVTEGLHLILFGLFKKLVIANRLSYFFTDKLLHQPESLDSTATAIYIIFLSFQIYADFSGYTDIALGTAKLFGINLSINFRQPYFSTSVTDFWRRWHITLSRWLRDYIYIPLGGNRVSISRQLANIVITFTISGFWHGTGLNFILWGLLHGFLVAAERLRAHFPISHKPNLPSSRLFKNFSISTTFVAVSLLWVIFSAPNLSTGLLIISRLAAMPQIPPLDIMFQLAFHLSLILIIVSLDLLEIKQSFRSFLLTKNIALRWSVYFLIATATLHLQPPTHPSFIYFKF